jgi:hypothetical protein
MLLVQENLPDLMIALIDDRDLVLGLQQLDGFAQIEHLGYA